MHASDIYMLVIWLQLCQYASFCTPLAKHTFLLVLQCRVKHFHRSHSHQWFFLLHGWWVLCTVCTWCTVCFHPLTLYTKLNCRCHIMLLKKYSGSVRCSVVSICGYVTSNWQHTYSDLIFHITNNRISTHQGSFNPFYLLHATQPSACMHVQRGCVCVVCVHS